MAKKKSTTPSPAATTLDAAYEIPSIAALDPVATSTAVAKSQATEKGYLDLAEKFTIATPDDYAAADTKLHEIMVGKKHVNGLIDPIISPIYQGLEKLYELRRRLLFPFEQSETVLKTKMAGFKLEEKRQIDERDRAERVRLAKVQAEVDKQIAATPGAAPVRVTMMAPVAAPPVKGVTSSASFVKKVRVTSIRELVEAVELGLVPSHVGWELITVNLNELSVWFKTDPEGVASCPGLEVYDDARIAGR